MHIVNESKYRRFWHVIMCVVGQTHAQFCASQCSGCVTTSAQILCKSMLELCCNARKNVCRDAHKKMCRDAKHILHSLLNLSDAGWSCEGRCVVNGLSDVANFLKGYW